MSEKIPRIEAAKIALKQMLSGLADEGDARVGVIFYGHRVGWNLKKPDEVLRQSDYARPIPDDLRPSEDVEMVLPLGRFDQVVAGGVFDLMKTLKPWGETPLYLSLVDAIGEFAHDEPGTEKIDRRDHRRLELSIQFAESQDSRKRDHGDGRS